MMTEMLLSGTEMLQPADLKEVHRTFSPDALIETLSLYPDLVGDPEMAHEWIGNTGNVCLRSGQDFGMFDLTYQGVYTAHYFFSPETRGRKAIDLARQMLRKAFVDHGARSIRGLTPIDNRKALWMTRHLGFTSYGLADYKDDPHELFILTLDEFFGAK